MTRNDRQPPESLRGALAELRQRLQVLYGQRLRKVVLFGSQARGQAGPESDVDVLVVLDEPVDVCEEINRTSWIVSDLSLRHNLLISCVFMETREIQAGEEPLCKAVDQEGIEV